MVSGTLDSVGRVYSVVSKLYLPNGVKIKVGEADSGTCIFLFLDTA